MRFGDADVEVPLRKAFGELREPGAVGHRGRDTDDALVALGGGDQRVGERGREGRTRGLLLDPALIRMVRVGPDAVKRAAVVLGDVVAFALDGLDVQQHRTVDPARVRDDVDQRIDVVPVDGADVAEAHLFEDHRRLVLG